MLWRSCNKIKWEWLSWFSALLPLKEPHTHPRSTFSLRIGEAPITPTVKESWTQDPQVLVDRIKKLVISERRRKCSGQVLKEYSWWLFSAGQPQQGAHQPRVWEADGQTQPSSCSPDSSPNSPSTENWDIWGLLAFKLNIFILYPWEEVEGHQWELSLSLDLVSVVSLCN